MKAHIFLQDSKVMVITDEVPDRPKDLCRDLGYDCSGCPEVLCKCAHEKESYYEAIAKLKAGAVRVENKDEVMAMRNMRECGDWVRSEDLPVEGKLYSIECEVEYDRVSVIGKAVNPKKGIHSERVAILKPLKPVEDDQDKLWVEAMRLIFSEAERGEGLESSSTTFTFKGVKSKFNISYRKP